MNIILAPDSYKGSLSSIEVAEIMKKGIHSVNQKFNVIMKPMADGGEGTLEAMLASGQGEEVHIECTGPLGETIRTSYAILKPNIAIIELASIAGLIQVPIDKRNPDITTTFGLGEVMIDALNKGCTSIIIGLGGSATNDGGLGMLIALGMKAWDEHGKILNGFGADIHKVKRVDLSLIDSRIEKVNLKIACDVSNTLCGKSGASRIFGPQKGANQKQIELYDKSLDYYGKLIESEVQESLREMPGSGSAGGVGFALSAIGGRLVSGSELLANALNLEQDIEQANLVITGEGNTDNQTSFGKAPFHVAKLARKYDVPIVLLSGCLAEGDELDLVKGRFTGCFSIISRPLTLEESIEQAEDLLLEQTKQIIKLFLSNNEFSQSKLHLQEQ